MNTNLKHDSTETVQGIYNGVAVDFERYNFLEKALSTKETSVVISYIEGDEEPITGDQIAYGSWYDLDISDIQPYLDYLIENKLLKRELPDSTIGLVKPTFEELADYYDNQPEFNFYFYDGTEEPKKITSLKSLQYEAEYLHGSTDITADFREWFIENMGGRERAAEYQRSQPFIETEHELWINPTLKQLQEYNEMKSLDPQDNLDSFNAYDHVIHNETLSILQKELEDEGYLIFNGSQIRETLEHDFEDFSLNGITIDEWAKPVILNELNDDTNYVINAEISFKPIDIDSMVDERYGQGKPINAIEINELLKSILITQKGINHTEKIDTSSISFYSFNDLSDYLSIEEFESFHSAHEKITAQDVDVGDSFIEIGIGNSEYYKNSDDFKTEKDILDFVNSVFRKEKLDVEAKSFDKASLWRNRILQEDKNREEAEK